MAGVCFPRLRLFGKTVSPFAIREAQRDLNTMMTKLDISRKIGHADSHSRIDTANSAMVEDTVSHRATDSLFTGSITDC